KELFMLGVVIIRHEDRAGRRLRVVERIALHPSCECRPISIAKTSLEKLGHLSFAVELGGEPTIKGIAVVDSLLACQSGKTFSSDSKPVRLGVLLGAFSGPLCRLVPAPCRGYGDQGKDQCLDNFNHFQAGLRCITALAHSG